MKREYVVIVLLVLALVMVSSMWGISVMPNARTWQEVDYWDGAKTWNLNLDYNNALNNNVTTNQFQISGDQWRIGWACSSSYVVGSHFVIRVYDDSSGAMVKEITTTGDEAGNGSLDFDTEGTYHLQIFINGFSSWKVQVEQYK